MILLLLACPSDPDDTTRPIDSAGDAPVDTAPPPPLEVSITASEAFDPLREGRVWIDVSLSEGALARVSVADESGAEIAVLIEDLAVSDDFSWGGRDDSGTIVPAGVYTLTVEATRAEETTSAAVQTRSVRLGALEGTLGGERLPLIWHRGLGAGGYWPAPVDAVSFSLAALEEDGVAVSLPTPWDELGVIPQEPEVGINWPAAYAHDAIPTLSITLDGELAGLDAELTASIEGWSLTEGSVGVGETLSFVRDAPLAEGPRVVEESLTLQFLLAEEVVSQQVLELRLYALLGAHTFSESGPAYGAWVAAIDPALRALEGVEASQAAVLSALVEFIFRDQGLRYDTDYGASAYVNYQGGSWTRAHFNFTAFLARANGEVINCSDAAAILSGYANMLGAELSYLILNPSFELNYIMSIGGEDFTRCPFGPGGCGFSYHALTSPDGSDTIYDATLALDGDGDPRNLPGTEWLVQGVTGEGYAEALVRFGSPYYHSESKGTIQ